MFFVSSDTERACNACSYDKFILLGVTDWPIPIYKGIENKVSQSCFNRFKIDMFALWSSWL